MFGNRIPTILQSLVKPSPQLLRRGQACNSGSNDDNFSGRLARDRCPFKDAEVDVPVTFEEGVNSDNLG